MLGRTRGRALALAVALAILVPALPAASPATVLAASATTTLLDASPNPAATSQDVTLTAAVAVGGGGVPIGTVTFSDPILGDLGGPVTVADGVAALVRSLPAGSHALTATFTPSDPGTQDGSSSTPPLALAVMPGATVTLAAPVGEVAPNLANVPYGDPFTLLATVDPDGPDGPALVDDGSVTFSIAGEVPVTVPVVDGTASHTWPLPMFGTQINATYVDGSTYLAAGSVAQYNLAVLPVPVEVGYTAEPPTPAFADPVALDVTVDPTIPTASGWTRADLPVSGIRVYRIPFSGPEIRIGEYIIENGHAVVPLDLPSGVPVPAGANDIRVEYLGGFVNAGGHGLVPAFEPGSTTGTLSIAQATATVALTGPATVAYGTAAAFSVTVGPAAGSYPPTGVVRLFDGAPAGGVQLDGWLMGAPDGGTAVITLSSPLAVGSHELYATFDGATSGFEDPNRLGGTSTPLAVSVTKAAQAITFDTVGPRSYGDPDFTVSATGGGSGNPVTFSTLTTDVCLVSGATVTIVGAGLCTIDADQAGDGSHADAPQAHAEIQVARAGQATLAVNAVSPATYGTSQALTTSGGSGTGTVTYGVGASTACSVSGATLSITAGTGTCSVSATKAADANHVAQTSPAKPVSVARAAQAITFAAPAAKVFGNAPFTIGATAGSGLAVGFSSLTTAVCTVGGTTVTLVAAGSCTIRAGQTGSANWSAAPNMDRTFAVAAAAVKLVLGANRTTWETGVPITFTASVAPADTRITTPVTGSVAFRVDGTLKATVAIVGGTASYPAPALAAGSHSVSATYTPDPSGARYFAAGASAALTKTVIANTVAATGVGVSAGSIYPVVDAWLDAVAIRGTRLEPLSVSITVYSPAGAKVRATAYALAGTAYSYDWNGRTAAGTILAAGKYRVVQVLADAYGARATYTSYVTLSQQRMTWYTKTVAVAAGPRNYQARSTADTTVLSAPSTTSTTPLVMANATGIPTWVAAGYQFTLPAASTYTSLSFQASGSWTGATAPKIGLIPWNGGDWGSMYSLARTRTALGTTATAFYAQTLTNLSGIRSGRSVRAAIDSFAPPDGWGPGPLRYSITGVRLVVKYGILK